MYVKKGVNRDILLWAPPCRRGQLGFYCMILGINDNLHSRKIVLTDKIRIVIGK